MKIVLSVVEIKILKILLNSIEISNLAHEFIPLLESHSSLRNQQSLIVLYPSRQQIVGNHCECEPKKMNIGIP